MKYELKYDIIYSITAHESPDSLYNLIENIFLNNLNYKIGIILHLNIFMKDNFFTNIKDVIINELYYDKKTCNHTILKAHIDNFSYLKKKKIQYLFIVPLSSNCMLIKQIHIPLDYKFKNKIYEEEFSLDQKETKWHWDNILKNKIIFSILKKYKIPIRNGYHEGRIIFYDLFELICNFIIDNKIFDNIEQDCVFEEFLLHSLEAYFNNGINCLSYLKLYKDKIDQNNKITWNKLINISQDIFIVKRVPRNLNDNIRILVNTFSNIIQKKNGHFKLNNEIIHINFNNFYPNHNENNCYTRNFSINTFDVVNYKEYCSQFQYLMEKDIWIEKRYDCLTDKKYRILQYTRTKKKNIAILIRGASSLIDNWGLINLDECYESFYLNIITYFKKLNYDYDIYLCTYNSNDKNKIIKLYNPKKYIFKKYNKNINQKNNLIDLLNIIETKYDSYLITRFDLIYKKSLEKLNINFDFSYYLFRHPNKEICDVMYIISNKHFDIFKNYIINTKFNCGIHTNSFPFDINNIFNNKYYSDTDYSDLFILNNNPIYKLNRTRRWGFKNSKEALIECKKQNKYNKKMAILLYGISYHSDFKHFKYSKIKIDYRQSIENYKNILISYFKKKNFSIDIFIVTNDHNLKKDIINDYNPINYEFITDSKNQYDKYNKSKINNGPHSLRYFFTNTKKLKLLELCLNNSKKNKIYYDSIIMTRFDLKFNISLDEVNINYGMFNLVSVLENPNLIDDNFYLFPGSNLENFIKILKNNLNIWGHNFKDLFSEKFDINYLYNENLNIKYLNFYRIIRDRIN